MPLCEPCPCCGSSLFVLTTPAKGTTLLCQGMQGPLATSLGMKTYQVKHCMHVCVYTNMQVQLCEEGRKISNSGLPPLIPGLSGICSLFSLLFLKITMGPDRAQTTNPVGSDHGIISLQKRGLNQEHNCETRLGPPAMFP